MSQQQEPKQNTVQTPQKFEGKLVKKLRDAKASDPNFMADTDQVVVTLDDGTEHTVRRSELVEAPKTEAPKSA